MSSAKTHDEAAAGRRALPMFTVASGVNSTAFTLRFTAAASKELLDALTTSLTAATCALSTFERCANVTPTTMLLAVLLDGVEILQGGQKVQPLVDYFLDKLGANPIAIDKLAETSALNVAVRGDASFVPIVAKLIDCAFPKCKASSSVASPSHVLSAALHVACGAGGAASCAEIVQLLLSRGADLDAGDEAKLRRTPLHIAVEQQNLSLVKCLLERGGADVNARDIDGFTPLFMAVMDARSSSTSCAILDVLLDHGANPNDFCESGNSPLHFAAGRMLLRATHTLLTRGKANANVHHELICVTPLHAVAWSRSPLAPAVAKLLIEHGADPNFMDSDKRTPHHIAKANSASPELIAVLRGGNASAASCVDVQQLSSAVPQTAAAECYMRNLMSASAASAICSLITREAVAVPCVAQMLLRDLAARPGLPPFDASMTLGDFGVRRSLAIGAVGASAASHAFVELPPAEAVVKPMQGGTVLVIKDDGALQLFEVVARHSNVLQMPSTTFHDGGLLCAVVPSQPQSMTLEEYAAQFEASDDQDAVSLQMLSTFLSGFEGLVQEIFASVVFDADWVRVVGNSDGGSWCIKLVLPSIHKHGGTTAVQDVVAILAAKLPFTHCLRNAIEERALTSPQSANAKTVVEELLIALSECVLCASAIPANTPHIRCRGAGSLHQHRFCGTCAVDMLIQWAGLPHAIHERNGRRVFCPVDNCHAHISDDELQQCCPRDVVARHKAAVNEMLAGANDHVAVSAAQQMRELADRAGGQPLAAADASRLLDEVLAVRCPRCREPATLDFNKCLALQCSACNAHFCGYCGIEKRTSDHVHFHIMDLHHNVPRAPSNTSPLWSTQAIWWPIWVERRRAVVRRVLAMCDAQVTEQLKAQFELPAHVGCP